MTKGQRAGESPIGINVVEGKSYYWCACGKSSKQPFCDGSHKGTEFKSIVYKADQSKKVFFCVCKQTNDSLYVMASQYYIEYEYKALVFDVTNAV